jgi:hypothetical protein
MQREAAIWLSFHWMLNEIDAVRCPALLLETDADVRW